MKRHALAFVVLIASIVFGQPQTGGFGTGGNSGRTGPAFSQPLAFFEFAPTSGAGMGASCACSAVTGAKGEAVTFTRTGSAICSRQGLATTGIANGDLVSCAANLPRVEPSGGVLGLRVESARNNELARSEEINNAVWTDATVGGAAAPTLNGANSVTSPRGDLTAEDYSFPATGAAQVSGRLNPGIGSCSGVSCAQFIYVRAIGADATVDICNDKASVVRCQPCAAVTGSWTLCPIVFTGVGFDGLFIGNGSAWNGGTARGAARVAVWGAQRETSATYSTSYIPTVATSVTRNDEGGSVAAVVPNGAGCIAGNLQTTANTLGNGRIAEVWLDANNLFSSFVDVTSPTVRFTVGGVVESTFTTAASMPGGPFRVIATRVPSASRSVQLVGSAPSSAASALGAFTPTTIFLGRFGGTLAGFQPMGILTRIQIDPDPSRCR